MVGAGVGFAGFSGATGLLGLTGFTGFAGAGPRRATAASRVAVAVVTTAFIAAYAADFCSLVVAAASAAFNVTRAASTVALKASLIGFLAVMYAVITVWCAFIAVSKVVRSALNCVIAVLKTSTAALYSRQGLAFGVGEAAGAETGDETSVLSTAIAAADPPSTSDALRTTAAKDLFADIWLLSSEL
jgi:hypothetical protein